MNNNRKDLEHMELGELMQEVERGNQQAIDFLEQMSKDILKTKPIVEQLPPHIDPKLAEGIKKTGNKLIKIATDILPILETWKDYHKRHEEAIAALGNEKTAQAFIATLTPADLELLDEPTEKGIIPLLTPDGANWLEILEKMETWEAVILYEFKKDHQKQYRTRAKAEKPDTLPSTIPIITLNKYQNAISLYQQGSAYLQPLRSVDGLAFDNGKLFFNGMPFSTAKLQELRTKEGIENIDLPLLRTFYGIILQNFERTFYNNKQLQESVKVYVPDLAAYLGKSRNISKTDIKNIMDKVSSFQTVVGIIKQVKNGRIYENILPVLLFTGYNEANNTISFSSPYMNQVIQDLYDVSIKRDKKQQPKLKKNGEPQTVATHSYLIKSSIGKERNKKAAEIVVTVVTLIEQAGNNIPQIKAGTIIDRNPLLKESIEKTKSRTNQNLMLNRAFTKAWELLRTQTRLTEVYKDIQIPDKVPTMGNLDMVFTFPHNGKKGQID